MPACLCPDIQPCPSPPACRRTLCTPRTSSPLATARTTAWVSARYHPATGHGASQPVATWQKSAKSWVPCCAVQQCQSLRLAEPKTAQPMVVQPTSNTSLPCCSPCSSLPSPPCSPQARSTPSTSWCSSCPSSPWSASGSASARRSRVSFANFVLRVPALCPCCCPCLVGRHAVAGIVALPWPSHRRRLTCSLSLANCNASPLQPRLRRRPQVPAHHLPRRCPAVAAAPQGVSCAWHTGGRAFPHRWPALPAQVAALTAPAHKLETNLLSLPPTPLPPPALSFRPLPVTLCRARCTCSTHPRANT